MQQYYKFDGAGYFVEPVIAEYDEDHPMPADVTGVRPPDGMYHGRFDGAAWVEDAPMPEIDPDETAHWDSDAKEWHIEQASEPDGDYISDSEALAIILGGAK